MKKIYTLRKLEEWNNSCKTRDKINPFGYGFNENNN